MKTTWIKKAVYFFAGLLTICIIVYGLLTLWMNADLGDFYPDSATSTTMHVLKRRFLHYAKLNNKLPKMIEELPSLEGFANRTTDAWGNKIKMEIKGTEITLISFGKDNKPGGNGANLDFIAVFDAKTVSGAWADENDDGQPSWRKNQRIRWDKSEYK